MFWLPHQRTGPVCAVRYRKTFFVSRLSFFVKLVPRFRDLASRSGISWHRLFAALSEHVGSVSNLSVSRAVKERSRAPVEERTEPATTTKVATLSVTWVSTSWSLWLYRRRLKAQHYFHVANRIESRRALHLRSTISGMCFPGMHSVTHTCPTGLL